MLGTTWKLDAFDFKRSAQVVKLILNGFELYDITNVFKVARLFNCENALPTVLLIDGFFNLYLVK